MKIRILILFIAIGYAFGSHHTQNKSVTVATVMGSLTRGIECTGGYGCGGIRIITECPSPMNCIPSRRWG
jgi:hypothetical protein